MRSSEDGFGTAINCIDGRAQKPVADWLRSQGIAYVDTVTDAGVDGVFAHGGSLEALRKNVGISVSAHKSPFIVVAGHHDCAGNPVSKAEHWNHIRTAVEIIRSWKLPVKNIAGLWVNERWEVEEIISCPGAAARS
ncbi:hypothetical protein HY213_03855 [Candidatus Peregrinibacteria bacterium]|nr:hypothetical protein [Candidatus Peregrinibacteria bacterium]